MKYPKLRNGPNPVGEALSRALQRTDAPFLSAEGVGYGANKYGNGAEVYGGTTDGFYMVGASGTGYTLVSSPDARSFHVEQELTAGNALTQPLMYMGAGRGCVRASAEGIGPAGSIGLLHTDKRGKIKASGYMPLVYLPPHRQFLRPIAGAKHNGAWSWGTLAVVLNGATDAAPIMYCAYDYTLDGQVEPSGSAGWASQYLGYGPGYSHGFPQGFRIRPDKLIVTMATEVILRPTVASGLIEQRNTRWSVFVLLSDNGATAQVMTPGAMSTELAMPATIISTPDGGGGWIDSGPEFVAEWINQLNILPLADGTILYLSRSRYYDPEALATPGETGFRSDYEDAIKLYKGDELGNTVAHLDIELPAGTLATVHTAILLGDKPIIIVYPKDSTAHRWLLVGDKTGDNWGLRSLPFASNMSGDITAISPTTLACPVYDATEQAYVLMHSTDAGQTWAKRATIRRNVPAPDPASLAYLTPDFYRLVYMRKAGSAAPTFPGAPWIGDSSKTPPWMTP